MTEDEAKKKWCPMRRMVSIGGEVCITNADPGHPFTLNCIGSACMMWCVAGKVLSRRIEGPRSVDVFLDAGYCGLAGKPTP